MQPSFKMKRFDAQKVTNSSWVTQDIPDFKLKVPQLKKPTAPGETGMDGYPRSQIIKKISWHFGEE